MIQGQQLHTRLFTQLQGIQVQVLMLDWQVLYWLRHLTNLQLPETAWLLFEEDHLRHRFKKKKMPKCLVELEVPTLFIT